MKKYLFNGTEYTDLNSLGEAYASDFGLAIQDAFTNTKKLLKFIKKCDKKKAQECVRYFIECKYQNNVVTFLIFTLCNSPRVIINGLLIDFPNFVKIIARERNNKALNAFIEDFGISKTYAKMDFDKFLATDAYLIEKHFKEDFTYQYFSNYFKIDYADTISSMLSNVFIYDEEVFRRGVKIINTDKFQLLLAHKAGLKPVLEMRNANIPLFKALRILRDEFSEVDLTKFIDDTFYMFLTENLEKYQADKYAKGTLNDLINLKKEYDHKKDKNFDDKIDYAEQVYDLYVKFVEFNQKGNIKVKKRYDSEQYTLNIKYSTSFICPAYIKNHTVNLHQAENEDGELVDAPEVVEVLDKPVKNKNKNKDEFSFSACQKQRKTINKLLRFSVMFIILTIISVLGIAAGAVFTKFIKVGLKYNAIVDDIILWGLLGGCALIAIIMTGILRFRAAKSARYLNEYMMAYKTYDYQNNQNITIEQEKKRDYIFANEAKYRKIAFRCQRFYSAFTAMFGGLVFGGAGLFVTSLFFDFKNVGYTSMGIGMAFALLYGIFRKRKGAFTAILMFVVAAGAAAAMAILI